ncbi:MAG: DUF5717 family protein, partial [Lachnospiraceae bacterium]|nr:DUF5717 family protein [Lachnospiraceae bacterium]
MKNVINRILEGEYRSDQTQYDLTFSHEKITGELINGEEREDVFWIYGPIGVPPGAPEGTPTATEGYVYTDDMNVELHTTEFAGPESQIAFCFRAKKSLPTLVRRGEFTIVSNHGEYTVPYEYTIVAREIESSLGSIKNLFHFTNLAKSNWREALELFYSPDFLSILSGQDRQYVTVYRGLTGASPSQNEELNEHNLEEFLLAIKKKQKIEYKIAETKVEIPATPEPMEHSLKITRSGWGYTALACQAEGDFLTVGKDFLGEDDFTAGVCHLPYYIDYGFLHGGRNYGRIIIRSAYAEFIIDITVSKYDSSVRKGVKQRQVYKRHIFEMMDQYVAFRAKIINQTTWQIKNEMLTDSLMAAGDKELLPKLFRAQLMLTENRVNEAGKMLAHAENALRGREKEEPELWCYYLYLTTLESREDALTSTVAEEVERIYKRSKSSWQIAWLLCYLKEEYLDNPAKKWKFLGEIISSGCRSPIIYVEAWQALRQNPALLTRLQDFEIHLLSFAARRGILQKNLIPQIVYLIGKSKTYSPTLYRILQACYAASPSDEVVQGICELLIKGGKSGPDYADWFRLGVQKDVKVTRLFEYYLLSLPKDKEEKIPKQVFLYFAYNNEPDARYHAYLYAHVHKNRELYPDIYANYAEKIERFVVDSLAQGRTGQWLALLYRNYITNDMLNDKNAAALVEILFGVRITVFRQNIREILVLYDKGNREITYRISGGEGNIVLYGRDYHLFLVDEAGNRFANPGDYQIERWLKPDRLGRIIAPLVSDRIGFDIWLCEKGDDMALPDAANLAAYQRIFANDYLKSPYRETVCLNLLRYYQENDMPEPLERMLLALAPRDIDQGSQEEVLKMMIGAALYQKAYEWLLIIGETVIDTKLLLRALSACIDEEATSADRAMLALAYRAFDAAKYDEKTLTYLARFYNGSLRRLRDIWKAVKEFNLDTYALSERLLIQMLYSGAYVGERMAIFAHYVASGGKTALVSAFVAQTAHDYFVDGKITDVIVFRQIQKLLEQGEELDFVC